MKSFFELLRDLWCYARATRKIAIALLILFLLCLGAVIVLTESSAVMPFIYTIF